MAIHTKLTVRDTTRDTASGNPSAPAAADKPGARRQVSDEERALRKERVAAAKDALKRSVGLRGEQVAPARAALKLYLQRLNEARQPDDATFKALIEAPFQAPPRKKERR